MLLMPEVVLVLDHYLKLKKEQEVPKGGVLEIKSNDTGTKNDLPVWAKKAGHKFLGYLEVPGYDRIFIQRGK